jgi:signal transduction histidine kinase
MPILNSKGENDMLRLIHNRSIVKYFLAALGIAFAFYFAWSFYPFGEWVGKHFLQDAPGGPQLLGIVSALILGGCVLIVVFYKEYIREDTQAYSLATGDASFVNAFKWFVWFVLGMELFSVLFRAILLNFSAVSWVMLGVGLMGMGVTYVVGKILHVQVNRTPAVAAKYMRENAARSVFEEGDTLVTGGLFKKSPFTTAQKRQIAGGNPQPVDDVRDEKAREREHEVKAVEERHKIAEEEQARNNDFYQKMIATPDSPSSNGHSKSPSFK